MARTLKTPLAAALTLTAFTALTALTAGCGTASDARGMSDPLGAEVAGLGEGTLTADAGGDLLFMVEEEKLARDVYARLNTQFPHRTFQNIGRSETRHVAALEAAIAAYGQEDPLAEDVAGRFANPDLQALYDQLIAAGGGSLEDALRVGALVEETDLRDLKAALAESPPADVGTLYTRLAAGSENHLRAFTRSLADLGVTYAPQVLAQAEFDAILAAPHGRGGCGCGQGNGGHGNGNGGQGRGMGRGHGG